MKSIVAVAASLILPVKPMVVPPMAAVLNPSGASFSVIQQQKATALPAPGDAISPKPVDSLQSPGLVPPLVPTSAEFHSSSRGGRDRKAGMKPTSGRGATFPAVLDAQFNSTDLKKYLDSAGQDPDETNRERAETAFNSMLGIVSIGASKDASAPIFASLPAAAHKLAATGYFLGNGIALCVDIPRIYATARSRAPKAVSISANALFMLSSVLSGARGFLGLDLFWAWQNLFSGLMVMTIGILTNRRISRCFPQNLFDSSALSKWGRSEKEYPHAVAAVRLLIVCALTAMLPLALGLLGSAYLVPLARAAWSPAAQLALQVAATTIYLRSYVVQMLKINRVNSRDGISIWEKKMLIAMGLGLGFWALRNAFINAGPTLTQTMASLEFWKYFAYFLEKIVGIYVWAATLRLMSKIQK